MKTDQVAHRTGMTLLTISRASCNTTACRQGARQQPNILAARQGSLQAAAQISAQRHACHGALRWRHAASPAGVSRSARLRCRAASDSDDEDERLPEGTRVRVKQSVMVYHAPKRKEGLDLEGMEGEVQAYVDDYKGKKLSSNLPVKVRFLLDNDGKETKFFSHLVSAQPCRQRSRCTTCFALRVVMAHLRLHCDRRWQVGDPPGLKAYAMANCCCTCGCRRLRKLRRCESAPSLSGSEKRENGLNEGR